MARLYEYQGKEIFKNSGITIPEGEAVKTPEDAKNAAERIGKPVVVKAQVWAGGRGKSGAVRFADTPDEAAEVAGDILGMEVKGLEVKQVLVEEKLDIAEEFYVGAIINSAREVRAPVLMFSTEGGVDIESVPEDKIAMFTVDVLRGVQSYDTLNMALSVGVSGKALRQVGDIIQKLYSVLAY